MRKFGKTKTLASLVFADDEKCVTVWAAQSVTKRRRRLWNGLRSVWTLGSRFHQSTEAMIVLLSLNSIDGLQIVFEVGLIQKK